MDKKSNRLKYISYFSLIFSLISLLSVLSIVLAYLSPHSIEQFIFQTRWLNRLLGYASVFSIVLGWSFPLIGIILGLIAIKKNQNNPAVLGTLLSVLGLIGYIYMFLIALRAGQG